MRKLFNRALELIRPVEETAPSTWLTEKSFANRDLNTPKLQTGCLNTRNHAVYIGKICPPGLFDKAKRLILGEEKAKVSGTYTTEFIKAALEVVIAHADEADGFQPVIGVGYKLSEFCNGTASTEAAISYKDEIELIKSVGREEFEVEVIFRDMLLSHPSLKTALEGADKDENTGRIVLDSVFKDASPVGPSERVSTLQIAYTLYEAAKDCPTLLNHFKDIPTGELKDMRTASDTELDPIDAYGLFEVAIRISDALHGITYQGGIDRQWKYDLIIQHILSGGGPYKESKALAPLAASVSEVPFRSFSVDREKNDHARRVKHNRSRIRGCIGAALGSAAAITLTLTTQAGFDHSEKVKRETIKEAAADYLHQTWGSSSCRLYDNWDTTKLSDLAASYIEFTAKELQIRYKISEDESWDLAVDIVKNIPARNVCGIRRDKRILIMEIDKYMINSGLVLALSDEPIVTPFEDLQGYYHLVSTTARTTDDCESLDELKIEASWLGDFSGFEEIEEYSVFYPPSHNDIDHRSLFTNGDVLMATWPTYKHVTRGWGQNRIGTLVETGEYLSNVTACKIAKSLDEDMRRYHAMSFDEDMRELMLDVFRPGTFAYNVYSGQTHLTKEPRNNGSPSATYAAYDGEYTFELDRHAELRQDSYSREVILTAKTPDEDVYSTETGWLAACHYVDDLTAGFSNDSNEYYMIARIDITDDLDLDSDLLARCPTIPNSFGKSGKTYPTRVDFEF